MESHPSADQVLTDVRVIELAANVGVIEKLILSEEAPFRIEVVIEARAGLESEPTVIGRAKSASHSVNIHFNIATGLAPPAADPTEEIGLESATSIRSVAKDQVSHEAIRVKESLHRRDLSPIKINVTGRI